MTVQVMQCFSYMLKIGNLKEEQGKYGRVSLGSRNECRY